MSFRYLMVNCLSYSLGNWLIVLFSFWLILALDKNCQACLLAPLLSFSSFFSSTLKNICICCRGCWGVRSVRLYDKLLKRELFFVFVLALQVSDSSNRVMFLFRKSGQGVQKLFPDVRNFVRWRKPLPPLTFHPVLRVFFRKLRTWGFEGLIFRARKDVRNFSFMNPFLKNEKRRLPSGSRR